MSTNDSDDGDRTPRRETPATILLAEDDRAFRETLRFWLTDSGYYQIREASNGEQALASVDETVDVLVVDRQMPKLPGAEVVERLDGTSFDGTVIVLSARRPDRQLSRDDVAEYLLKPVDHQLFLDVLERYL